MLNTLGKCAVVLLFTGSVIGSILCIHYILFSKEIVLIIFFSILQCFFFIPFWITIKMAWLEFKGEDIIIRDIYPAIKYKIKAFKASRLSRAPLYINDPDLRIRMVAKKTLEGG